MENLLTFWYNFKNSEIMAECGVLRMDMRHFIWTDNITNEMVFGSV